MKHEIEIHPFSVPNFVRPVQKPGSRQDGYSEAPAIPLSELSLQTLEGLCDQFRADVMKKAGKIK